MSYGRVTALTMIAARDLVERRFHVLRQSGQDGELPVVDIASNAGGSQSDVVGVCWTKAHSGRSVAVAVDGEADVTAGGAVTAGKRVAPNSSGRIVDAVSGQWTVGTAQEAATQNGEIIRVLLQLPAVRLEF